MICEKCQGTGIIYTRIFEGWIPFDTVAVPCDECGASGIVHCCEGEQAQPESEAP
jgi:DnaJ-class molecular chaperone